jgi:hypothetical protein
MRKLVTCRTFLTSPQYAGTPELMGGASWQAWRILLIAAMGEPLEPDELPIFRELTGRSQSPAEPVKEFFAITYGAGGQERAVPWLPLGLTPQPVSMTQTKGNDDEIGQTKTARQKREGAEDRGEIISGRLVGAAAIDPLAAIGRGAVAEIVGARRAREEGGEVAETHKLFSSIWPVFEFYTWGYKFGIPPKKFNASQILYLLGAHRRRQRAPGGNVAGLLAANLWKIFHKFQIGSLPLPVSQLFPDVLAPSSPMIAAATAWHLWASARSRCSCETKASARDKSKMFLDFKSRKFWILAPVIRRCPSFPLIAVRAAEQ